MQKVFILVQLAYDVGERVSAFRTLLYALTAYRLTLLLICNKGLTTFLLANALLVNIQYFLGFLRIIRLNAPLIRLAD